MPFYRQLVRNQVDTTTVLQFFDELPNNIAVLKTLWKSHTTTPFYRLYENLWKQYLSTDFSPSLRKRTYVSDIFNKVSEQQPRVANKLNHDQLPYVLWRILVYSFRHYAIENAYTQIQYKEMKRNIGYAHINKNDICGIIYIYTHTHESKEQQICSANRSNKGYSRAYTLWFQPSHLQVIRFLHANISY